MMLPGREERMNIAYRRTGKRMSGAPRCGPEGIPTAGPEHGPDRRKANVSDSWVYQMVMLSSIHK